MSENTQRMRCDCCHRPIPWDDDHLILRRGKRYLWCSACLGNWLVIDAVADWFDAQCQRALGAEEE